MSREGIPVLIGVQLHVHANLPQIVQTGRAIRLRLGLGQRWKQHRRENGDDGYDHKQFDKCETAPPTAPARPWMPTGFPAACRSTSQADTVRRHVLPINPGDARMHWVFWFLRWS
jgi:hypothetical protein